MIDKQYLNEIVEVFNENNLTEIFLKDGEKEIILRKEKEVISAAPVQISAPSQLAGAVSQVACPPEKKGKPITSPMVGTFYKSFSPEADAFVQIGSTIAEGQVVCIIEAMKLMNEIESDTSGKVVEICVEDGQPVEFGQVLMYVE